MRGDAHSRRGAVDALQQRANDVLHRAKLATDFGQLPLPAAEPRRSRLADPMWERRRLRCANFRDGGVADAAGARTLK